MGGVPVPANTPLYGTVRIEGQRMAVTVNSIESGGNILPVELVALLIEQGDRIERLSREVAALSDARR